MAFLKIIGGDRDGEQFEIDRDEAIIGRTPDCFISIDDPAVSGRHCAVIREENRYILRDLESTNGTSMNGTRIREAQLSAGDIISIGSVQVMLDGDDIDGLNPPVTPTVKRNGGEAPIAATTDGVGVDAPFGTRKSKGNAWWIIGALVALALAGLLYWFLSGLFKV